MKKFIAALALTVTATAASAFTQPAYLAGQRMGQSITGQYGMICIYRLPNGAMFEMFIGSGMCPITINVR